MQRKNLGGEAAGTIEIVFLMKPFQKLSKTCFKPTIKKKHENEFLLFGGFGWSDELLSGLHSFKK